MQIQTEQAAMRYAIRSRKSDENPSKNGQIVPNSQSSSKLTITFCHNDEKLSFETDKTVGLHDIGATHLLGSRIPPSHERELCSHIHHVLSV